jgi:hypothetical protein
MQKQTLISANAIRSLISSIQFTGRENNLRALERRLGFKKDHLRPFLQGQKVLLPEANKLWKGLVKYYQVNPKYLLREYEPKETGIKNGCRVFTSHPYLVTIDNDYQPNQTTFSNN